MHSFARSINFPNSRSFVVPSQENHVSIQRINVQSNCDLKEIQVRKSLFFCFNLFTIQLLTYVRTHVGRQVHTQIARLWILHNSVNKLAWMEMTRRLLLVVEKIENKKGSCILPWKQKRGRASVGGRRKGTGESFFPSLSLSVKETSKNKLSPRCW